MTTSNKMLDSYIFDINDVEMDHRFRFSLYWICFIICVDIFLKCHRQGRALSPSRAVAKQESLLVGMGLRDSSIHIPRTASLCQNTIIENVFIG